MKKYSKLILFALFICAIIFNVRIVASAEDTSDYYRERLEFDEKGTLLMTTHDKKATTRITYRTLGWIIKRYDAPVDAKGQQYAVVKLKKFSDITYRDDPNNSAYKYCYYYGDKDDIYNAIGKASKGWQNQLYKYGDYIYIDEVMTVCVNGVPTGKLLSSSSNCVKSEGEVYINYYGIVNARAWASPGSLLTHFNKRVKYPRMVKAPKFSISEDIVDTEIYSNTPVAMGKIGHYKKNQESFEVVNGVPSGEKLYASVNLDKAIYNIEFNRYLGSAYFPVKVVTTYHLKWKDTNGNNRSEDFKAVRWYQIKRSFSYWTVDECTYKYLDSVRINNYALPGGSINISSDYTPVISKSHENGYKNHISISSYTRMVEVDGGTVKGKNGLRPSIPNDNYSKLASEQVGKYNVKNDKLVINSDTILSNKNTTTRGTNPKSISTVKIDLYKDENIIAKNKLNGNYTSSGTATYIDYSEDSEEEIAIVNLNDVMIHTPVVCEASVGASYEYNQEINPILPDCTIVIGQPFTIDVSTEGEHKNFMGYMFGDYSKYVGEIKVKFPFEVYYQDKRYSKNKWISLVDGNEFVLPIGTKEDVYTVSCMTIAYNIDTDKVSENAAQQGANTDFNNYSARSDIPVKVVGSIHSYEVYTDDKEDEIFTVGDKNYKEEDNGSEFFMPMEIKREKIGFNVITMGNSSSNSKLEMKLEFFYIKNNSRQEVNIYKKHGNKYRKVNDTILLDNQNFTYIGDEFSYVVSDTELAKEGTQKWTGEIDMSGNLIILPKGKYADTVVYSHVSDNVLKGGNLIINSDIYTKKNDERILTYMKGHCNMWKREGFDYKNIFIDGDCLVTDRNIILKNDYNIVGTH